MSHTQQRLVQLALLTVIVIGALIGGYFAFRRTLIADLRESALNIDTSDPVAHGAVLFQTRGCVGCHTLDRAGSLGDEGPDLSRLAERADAAAIRQSIATPNAVIATGCPEGACEPNVMPPYGTILTDAQIDALVAWLTAAN